MKYFSGNLALVFTLTKQKLSYLLKFIMKFECENLISNLLFIGISNINLEKITNLEKV